MSNPMAWVFTKISRKKTIIGNSDRFGFESGPSFVFRFANTFYPFRSSRLLSLISSSDRTFIVSQTRVLEWNLELPQKDLQNLWMHSYSTLARATLLVTRHCQSRLQKLPQLFLLSVRI